MSPKSVGQPSGREDDKPARTPWAWQKLLSIAVRKGKSSKAVVDPAAVEVSFSAKSSVSLKGSPD